MTVNLSRLYLHKTFHNLVAKNFLALAKTSFFSTPEFIAALSVHPFFFLFFYVSAPLELYVQTT